MKLPCCAECAQLKTADGHTSHLAGCSRPATPCEVVIPDGDLRRYSDLRVEWQALFGPAGHSGAVLTQGWLTICEGYDRPYTHYHTFEHVYTMLANLEVLQAVTGVAVDFHLVKVAAWFHDVVYIPGDKENEVRSAMAAAQFANSLGWSSARSRLLYDVIKDTRHIEPVETNEGKLLCDCDLLPLAAPRRSDFAEASFRVWNEAVAHQPGLSRQEFNHKRCAWINSMLAKSHIFHLPHVRANCEEQARSNLSDELRALELTF